MPTRLPDTGRSRAAARRLGSASRLALAGGLALLGLTAPAMAQTAPADAAPAPTAVQAGVYAPAFFARFAPRSAADMVQNLPGFQISEASEERGFGQASENVLINGRRISGKSSGALDALGRIGAESVVRIEIIDGAALNIPGLSGQVANVIAEVDSFGGRWTYEPEFRERRHPALAKGSASINGSDGGLSWSLGVVAGMFRSGHGGPERVTNGAGVQTDLRVEDADYNGEEPSANASLTYETLAGTVANLNVSGRMLNFKGDEESTRNPVGAPSELRLFQNGEDFREGEIGADVEFGMGPGRLKLIALQRQAQEDDVSISRRFVAGQAAPTGQRFTTVAEAGESILRSEYAFGAWDGDWQWSLEGAFNYFDLASTLETLQADGSFARQALPDATARVEEKRAESNLTYGRKLSAAWALQASLGGEYSQLAQTGPNGREREFVRPKGFLALVWTADRDLDVNFKVERKVGQLDFGDFISSVDLENENRAEGNPELAPEQSWIGSIEANRKLGKWGAVKLVADVRRIEDIVDQIPIGATGSGTGNIDKADAWSAQLSGTLNLDPAGWKGAQLEFRLLTAESSVADPLTGVKRAISEAPLFEMDATLRYDVPETPWTLALGLEQRRNAPVFQLDQIGHEWSEPLIAFGFVENKDVFGMKARVMVVNLLDTDENFRRDVFDGRRTGALLFTEDRRRHIGPILRFNLSGTF